MIVLIICLLAVALIASLFGLVKLMAAATEIAVVLFAVFVALFVIGFLYRHLIHRHK